MGQFIAVVGKNFGDEGKGLAVDYFSRKTGKVLVVRHNGGAQSGHTVETNDCGFKRFVFHELSSGSFAGADTFWANTFYPDLFKLTEEINSFKRINGTVPKIYAMETTVFTTIDDVLINMAAETSRGNERHGSCGMGINECDLRNRAGFGITLVELSKMSPRQLENRLLKIRREYIPERIAELGLNITAGSEYLEMLQDETVIRNYCETVIASAASVQLISEAYLKEFLLGFELVIFETGQGLLLDCGNEKYAPNVTASHTGLDNALRLLKTVGLKLDEAVFVTRTYLTRHGAGRLEGETLPENIGMLERDFTNRPNDWQGSIRYAPHKDVDSFCEPVRDEIIKTSVAKASLFITHLNETCNQIVFKDCKMTVQDLLSQKQIYDVITKVYLSDTKYSSDVKEILV